MHDDKKGSIVKNLTLPYHRQNAKVGKQAEAERVFLDNIGILSHGRAKTKANTGNNHINFNHPCGFQYLYGYQRCMFKYTYNLDSNRFQDLGMWNIERVGKNRNTPTLVCSAVPELSGQSPLPTPTSPKLADNLYLNSIASIIQCQPDTQYST